MNSTLGSVVPLAMFKSYPQILHEGTEVNNKIAEKFTQIQFDLRYRGAPKLGWHSDFSLDIEFSGASKWHSRHTIVTDNNSNIHSIITLITNTNINNNVWKKSLSAGQNLPPFMAYNFKKKSYPSRRDFHRNLATETQLMIL